MTTKLGASLALTGPEREYGGQTRTALELALEDAGLDGVQLRVEDDASDLVRAAHAAQALIEDDEVFAVVGPMNSWTAAVQAPLFAAAGLAQVTHSASSPELSASRWPTFRRLCPVDDLQGAILAEVAARIVRVRRVAAIGDGTGFATPLVQRFLAESARSGLQTEPAVTVKLEPAAPGGLDGASREALEDVVTAAVGAVLIAGLEEPCRAVALALRSRGCEAVYLGTDAIKPTRVLVTPGFVDGPYLTCSCAEASARAPGFDARMRARQGRHDSIYTVEAYDAARLLLEASRRARATEPAAGALRGALERELRHGIDLVGLLGPIRFDADGELADPSIGLYHYRGAELRFLGPHQEVLKR